MIYPLVESKIWAKRYGISQNLRPCDKCGKYLYPEVPVAFDEWRGLISKEHECGIEYNLAVFVTINKETNKDWQEIFNHLNLIINDTQKEER